MNRRYDIDALRVIAFAFLILYHIGMLYVHDWGWHIKSSYLSEDLQLPMLFINRWRMDLIFLISGLAAAFLLKPGESGRFLALRSWRLLLPLTFGIIFVVPVQPYVQGVTNGVVEPGFLSFLSEYYSARRWPVNAFDGWEHGYTWNHLWYLAYLWVYTLWLVLLLPLLRSAPGRWFSEAFASLRGPALLLLPALPLLFYTVALQPHFPERGDFIHDWYRNAVYFTVFLYGFVIARHDGFWAEALRLRKASLAVALGLFALYTYVRHGLPDDIPYWHEALIFSLRNFYIWAMLLAILGWAHALLNRPFAWLPRANEAVYPWYMLHQSLIVLIAYWLVPLKLGGLLEFALVLLGTMAGCGLLHEFLIRRVSWLRPLFGSKPAGPAREVPALRMAAYGLVPFITLVIFIISQS
ncbi:peptidoglycan/LPS O-acetylase OafA/YrhL [Tahibacter aquaticus]|uniref:Peptidoglycan/LPS O-acetylase OafA/YrhL n=1 Tax=Tahibacter aquaticus TaxID=520092 RepID=A0A4R6YMZ6_9GAMM|nr:acyltransferase family protein [Tahibacter aquaticus]TDR38732.1 peptidoglycan/LPS O-acetylase OafA/YrhL [Tahibacter aquaticus]